MTKKRGKNERKDEKLKKMMQKDVLYCVVFSRSGDFLVRGAYRE